MFSCEHPWWVDVLARTYDRSTWTEAVGLCPFEVSLVYTESSEAARDPVFALKQYRLLGHPTLVVTVNTAL